MLTMPIQEQLNSRYNGKHAAWISSMRITCIAVTNVTANPKASAVRLISGALPGIMPTASDSHGIPSHVPSAQAASAVAIIEPLSSTSTLAIKPGARRKKLRSKAAPNAQPMSNWPAPLSQPGMLIHKLLQATPTAQIRNGPKVQGLGKLQRLNPIAASRLMPRIKISHGQITGNGAGAAVGAKPKVATAGTASRINNRRRLWAAAIKPGSAWRCSPRWTISVELAGISAKNAVPKATPQRCSSHTEPNASTSVSSTAVTINPRCATTCCMTGKVKWQPIATATINCPASRPWGICGTIAPLHRLINTASNEPMLVFDNTFLQRHLLDAFCSNARVRFNIALESNFVPLVIAATRSGMGLSTLLRSVQEQEPGLAGVSFEPAQFMHFNLCWRGSEYLSQANRRFIETAKVYFQEDASSPLSH